MSALANTALSVSSSNFETHKFKLVNENTLLIQPTIGSLVFCGLFISIGLGLIVFWTVSTFSSFVGSSSIFLLLVGLLFAGLGLALYRSSNEQLIINHETGAAFIRSWWPTVPLNTESLFQHISPQQIEAIQLVSREVMRSSTTRSGSGSQNGQKSTSSYTQFQLNLCSIDNERFNALVTLKLDKAEKAGTLMAQILDVQLINQLEIHDVPTG